MVPFVSIELTNDNCLIVRCNELGFVAGMFCLAKILTLLNKKKKKENVRALCDIGQSTKTARSGYIGQKGIGFKVSAFQKNNRFFFVCKLMMFTKELFRCV